MDESESCMGGDPDVCSECGDVLSTNGESGYRMEPGLKAEDSPTGTPICFMCLEAWKESKEKDCPECRGF